jgi:[ribosomal protein S5]-alanine N-acetyltransferase
MVTRSRSRPAPAGFRVRLRPPRHADEDAFLAAVRDSRQLHGSWVSPPRTPEVFATFVRRYGSRVGDGAHAGFLALRAEDDALAGVFNFSQIARGVLCSAYLGYYAFAPQAGRGLMTEGMILALDLAYRTLRLHRVEVNVRPDNLRSIALVERIGFEREGYSRRYLKLAGRWRDHVRYAMLAEDWRQRRVDVLAALDRAGR